MLYYNKLNEEILNNMNIEIIKTNKKYNKKPIEYLNIESSFDIETSSIKIQEDKKTFMYIFMFGIGFDNDVYYGRTWNEFIKICKLLKKTFKLNGNKRIIVYVHNLSYEFQFMRNYFKWVDIFAVDERKPIKALCSYGIEFRDSYILSGYSLEKTGENLMSHNVKKLVGDLDYELIRTEKTLLTDTELMYCENDIRVVNAYINEQITQYKDISKIPLTNTGRVRTYVRNNCYYSSSNHRKSDKSKYIRYRKIMNDLTLETNEYTMLKRSFSGGFTHANVNYVNKVLNDVSSIDFTSSYPSVMLAELYPMSRGRKIEVKTLKQLEGYCRIYCLIFDIRLTKVESTIKQENYISESKCKNLKNPIINNGRVQYADELIMTITNVDYDIIKQCYKWDKISVNNVIRYHKNYLPKPIIESVLKLYEDKTVLKGVKGKETEYLLSKGMLNSVYGMCVTDIVQDNHIYDNEWNVETVDIDEEIKNYNESKNRFLYYPWGVFVTAYARRNLWTGIIAFGDDYIYSDTDSIKCLNYIKHENYIKWYNTNIINKLENMCQYYKLDKNLLYPKTIKGIKKPIGVWDFEGTYKTFKTLGAKRYLVEDGDELHLTVAGLSKQNGINYMMKKCKNDVKKVFNLFNDNLYIPSNETGKMTHTYIDDEMEFIIKDYQGNETHVISKSGVHLEKCDFTLSISKQFSEFIKNYMNGYIYKGVKNI